MILRDSDDSNATESAVSPLSQYVSVINFTFVLLGSTICDNELQEYFINLMTHPQFQTVLGGRPLLYLFQFGDQQAQACGGGWEGTKQVFNNFRQKITQRGIFLHRTSISI